MVEPEAIFYVQVPQTGRRGAQRKGETVWLHVAASTGVRLVSAGGTEEITLADLFQIKLTVPALLKRLEGASGRSDSTRRGRTGGPRPANGRLGS